MNQDQKFITQYLKTIIELSNETGMSKKETKTILDISLSNQNPKLINFEKLKTEIKTFITIIILIMQQHRAQYVVCFYWRSTQIR